MDPVACNESDVETVVQPNKKKGNPAVSNPLRKHLQKWVVIFIPVFKRTLDDEKYFHEPVIKEPNRKLVIKNYNRQAE